MGRTDTARRPPDRVAMPGARALLRERPMPALVSVVCPAYNEAEGLEEFIRRVSHVLRDSGLGYEIVLVNDGSTDHTLLVLEELSQKTEDLTIVNLTRNFGKELALTAGLQHAMGDIVVILDADLQDPPELIPEFIAEYTKGYDVVYGRRISREGETWLKTRTASLFYRLMKNVGAVPLPSNVGDFRLISRRVVDALLSLPERHRFMKGLFAWVGFPSTAIDYVRHPRFAGGSKWNYLKLIGLSIEGITSFTIFPLRIVTLVGFGVAMTSFLYGTYILVRTLLFGDPVAGFPTIFLTMLILGGVQLIALGVIGEYLGRIFNEVKGRPLYLVESVRWSRLGKNRNVLNHYHQ
jgi:polyisoprenyl-phosphate glycosyltransferase